MPYIREPEYYVHHAAKFIKERLDKPIDVAIVLGSGLADLVDAATDIEEIPFNEIPNFPVATVEGHEGKLIIGTIGDSRVLMMKGRFHFYEGYDLETVTFPIRGMHELGVKNIILTNAAGAVNTDYEPGDVVLIKDHINLGMQNPLIGPNNKDYGPRFPDMTEAYSKKFRDKMKQIAADKGLNIKEGVYTFLTGPSYETPAEIKMIRTLGGDMVGMSTVPEVIVARHQGMNVLGISYITNMGAGILDKPLDHNEVLERSKNVKEAMLPLLETFIRELKTIE